MNTNQRTIKSTSISFTRRCVAYAAVYLFVENLEYVLSWSCKYIYYCVNQSEQTCPFSKVLAFLNSGVDEERAVHVGSSMKERRKSISNSSTAPNSSSNMGERRSSMSNILERRSSFSNTSSGHSPPSSNMLSPPPAVQVCFALLIINFHVIQTCMKRVNALCFVS